LNKGKNNNDIKVQRIGPVVFILRAEKQSETSRIFLTPFKRQLLFSLGPAPWKNYTLQKRAAGELFCVPTQSLCRAGNIITKEHTIARSLSRRFLSRARACSLLLGAGVCWRNGHGTLQPADYNAPRCERGATQKA
jgi:hypothetical protein